MDEQAEQARLRELVTMQFGSQVLQLCELTAKAEALAAHLATVTKERDELKAEKAGVSAS